DGAWKHDYLLSNEVQREPLPEFARVFKAEHRVEECLQRAKSEAGLADYQVRTWEGGHHHQALSLVAAWFLTQEARRGKKTDTGFDGAAGACAHRRAAEPDVEGLPSGTHRPHRPAPLTPQRGGSPLPLASTQTLGTAAG